MIRERLEDRIVEIVFSPWSQIPDKLRKLGLSVRVVGDGDEIVIDNGYQKHGFHRVDPVTTAVMISAALSGSFAVGKYFPGLLDKVKKQWKLQTKLTK